MVFKKIYFVNVEKSAIGASEQSKLERFDACCERAFYVDAASYAVFRSAQRHVNYGHNDTHARQFSFFTETRIAIGAMLCLFIWIAVEWATAHNPNGRQKVCERTNGCRLPGAAMTHDEHASNGRRYDAQDERELHLLLPNDCGEGKGRAHVSLRSFCCARLRTIHQLGFRL